MNYTVDERDVLIMATQEPDSTSDHVVPSLYVVLEEPDAFSTMAIVPDEGANHLYHALKALNKAFRIQPLPHACREGLNSWEEGYWDYCKICMSKMPSGEELLKAVNEKVMIVELIVEMMHMLYFKILTPLYTDTRTCSYSIALYICHILNYLKAILTAVEEIYPTHIETLPSNTLRQIHADIYHLEKILAQLVIEQRRG